MLCGVAGAVDAIAARLRRLPIAGTAAATAVNIQGEQQAGMDVESNIIMKERLFPLVAAMASEEEDALIGGTVGKTYEIAFDPLDGSSNLDTRPNIGILERETRRVYHHAASTPGNRDSRPSPRQAAAACQQAARRDIRRHVHLRSAAPL